MWPSLHAYQRGHRNASSREVRFEQENTFLHELLTYAEQEGLSNIRTSKQTLHVPDAEGFRMMKLYYLHVWKLNETTEVTDADVCLLQEPEILKIMNGSQWHRFQAGAYVLFLPGVVHLDDKILLSELLAETSYHPRTYVSDIHRVPRLLRGTWIEKAARGSSGKQVRLLHNPSNWNKKDHVLQEYMLKPLLYRNKYKFDLRILCIVFADGRYMVYPDAVMRCCSSAYTETSGPGTLHERKHLTNVCVQSKYCRSQDEYVNFLSSEPDLYERCWSSAYATVVDVLHRWFTYIDDLDESQIHGILHTAAVQEWEALHFKKHPQGFRLLGFDILPLANGRSTCIEVNYQPGMCHTGKLGRFYGKALSKLLRCTMDEEFSTEEMQWDIAQWRVFRSAKNKRLKSLGHHQVSFEYSTHLMDTSPVHRAHVYHSLIRASLSLSTRPYLDVLSYPLRLLFYDPKRVWNDADVVACLDEHDTANGRLTGQLIRVGGFSAYVDERVRVIDGCIDLSEVSTKAMVMGNATVGDLQLAQHETTSKRRFKVFPQSFATKAALSSSPASTDHDAETSLWSRSTDIKQKKGNGDTCSTKPPREFEQAKFPLYFRFPAKALTFQVTIGYIVHKSDQHTQIILCKGASFSAVKADQGMKCSRYVFIGTLEATHQDTIHSLCNADRVLASCKGSVYLRCNKLKSARSVTTAFEPIVCLSCAFPNGSNALCAIVPIYSIQEHTPENAVLHAILHVASSSKCASNIVQLASLYSFQDILRKQYNAEQK